MRTRKKSEIRIIKFWEPHIRRCSALRDSGYGPSVQSGAGSAIRTHAGPYYKHSNLIFSHVSNVVFIAGCMALTTKLDPVDGSNGPFVGVARKRAPTTVFNGSLWGTRVG